jgi:hypothetical protein
MEAITFTQGVGKREGVLAAACGRRNYWGRLTCMSSSSSLLGSQRTHSLAHCLLVREVQSRLGRLLHLSLSARPSMAGPPSLTHFFIGNGVG